MGFWDDVLDVGSVVLPGIVGVTRAAVNTIGGALFPGAPPALQKIPAPPPPADLTDEAVRQARLGARRRALGGAGLSSTFLSGPLGDMSAPAVRSPTAGGY